MGTVIRPGRRPATVPALPQRQIPPMPAPPPVPEPIRFSTPATLERRPLTPEAAMAIHASAFNGLSREAAALLTAFYGLETGGTERVPVIATMGLNKGEQCIGSDGKPVFEQRSIPRRVTDVDAAMEALRGFLRSWRTSSPRLHALDQETGGAIRWTIKVAGIALARGEPMSVPFATYAMERATDAAVSHTAMETLVADILTMQRRFMPEPATA